MLKNSVKAASGLVRLSFLLTMVVAASIALHACDDEVTPPQAMPGYVIVTLVSQFPEGAVVLESTDEGVIDVELVDVTMLGASIVRPAEGEAFHSRSGGISRIVAYRDLAGEISIEVAVEDVIQHPEWQIVEVADGNNELRASLSGYLVTTMTHRLDPPQSFER